MRHLGQSSDDLLVMIDCHCSRHLYKSQQEFADAMYVRHGEPCVRHVRHICKGESREARAEAVTFARKRNTYENFSLTVEKNNDKQRSNAPTPRNSKGGKK